MTFIAKSYILKIENTRIKNLCDGNETTYTYNTNAKLSQLLTKTTNGVVTKYIYGLGLIGEEKQGYYRVYHFDLRGSTVAITDINGNITDTFKYDTYGKLVSRTGTSFIIFGYNGRDGVITDKNGLIYMRSRYYSPILKRFVNADVLHGSIADSTSLNRYSYVNGNPISYVDPFGLSAERSGPTALEAAYMANHIYRATNKDIGKQLGKVYGGWVLCDIIVDENGFKIGVYSRTTIDGKTEYTLVNKGSTTVSDWINNAQQPFGLSKDMAESIQIAKEFVEEHADDHITFVGHSKGGGEAESMALATNKDAILFNPAKANYLKYDVSGLNYDANMTSYVIEGEVLSSAYYVIDMLPAFEPLSKVTTFTHDNFLTTTVPDAVNMSPFLGERVLLPNPSGNTITDHSMASVIKVLWGEGYE